MDNVCTTGGGGGKRLFYTRALKANQRRRSEGEQTHQGRRDKDGDGDATHLSLRAGQGGTGPSLLGLRTQIG